MAPRILFDRSVCNNLSEALSREWLETNGIGGFACSTIIGAGTRRYHGLLTAATKPPAGRYLLLSKIEETLIVGNDRYELSTNLYPGVVHPEGYKYLAQFRMDPGPIFTFDAGGICMEKRVSLVQGENTVVVEYSTKSPHCRLELRPLIAFRSYHDLTHSNAALNATLSEGDGSVSIQPYPDLPRLWFTHNAGAIVREARWYFDFEYPVERERGLEFHEDLFCPFLLNCDLGPDKPVVMMASTIPHSAGTTLAHIGSRGSADSLVNALLEAAPQFIATRSNLRTIVAGYPWFTDWGRDAMISLPGLTLVTGKFDVARDLLLAFIGFLDQGMLPNRFPESGQSPEYNTVDSTLWLFEAARKYLDYTTDLETIRDRIYPALKEIISWHQRGTRFGIHAEDDGLLTAGDSTTNLTWMDATVNGRPVTPRNGKPVEIQALWYNALRFTASLASRFADPDTASSLENLAIKVGKQFNSSFWNESAGCLYDVIESGRSDDSIRPNQLIALSLGYCAIPAARAGRILQTLERDLLTPFGLRTLSPADPRYRGRYQGLPSERDAAYHQGTVWPWLLGPFITAQVRFNGEAGRAMALGLLQPIREFVLNQGVGQLAEIFDGNPPCGPRGCFAQAWSVAEILRSSVEDLGLSC